jgi:hypothetical protein
MDNLNDIQKIWLSANVKNLPTANEVLKTIKRYRLKQALKNISLLVVTLALVAIMVWVVFVYRSDMLTTRIGEACFFIAMFIIISINVTSLLRVSGQKNYSNDEFISFLKQEQIRLIRFTKRTQIIGFLIASAGLLLYLFEFSYTQNAWLLTYLPASIWILFCWFILRPIALKKKTKKLNSTIQKLEKLSGQLLNN